MGNLYTHLVRKKDRRLAILAELKQLWKNHPHDYSKINKLGAELKALPPLSPPEKPFNYQQRYGAFGWKAEQIQNPAPNKDVNIS